MASRVCWNCGQRAHMAPVGDSLWSADGEFWTRAYRCDSCRAASVAKTPYDLGADYRHFDECDEYFEEPDADIEWLPATVLGRRFEDVPSPIGDAASEAYACYSIRSYRAAILLARSVVEAVAKNQGVTDGPLVEKIDALEAQRVISPLMKDTAHAIRVVGNEMAHGDFVAAVDEEECDDVLNFMSALLDAVYQQPAKLTRFREQRERRRSEGRT